MPRHPLDGFEIRFDKMKPKSPTDADSLRLEQHSASVVVTASELAHLCEIGAVKIQSELIRPALIEKLNLLYNPPKDRPRPDVENLD